MLAPKRMLLILLGLAIAIALFLVGISPMVMESADATHTIKIPQNASSAQVRDSLVKYFGESYASKVMRLAKIRHADFSKRNGAYEIVEGTSPLRAARKITHGAQTPIRVTINGFRDRDIMADMVSAKFEFPADSLIHLMNDDKTMQKYGLTAEQALALFVDDTYEFYWTNSASEVIEKIGANYDLIWNQTRRQKARELGLTPAQVMIVASIADGETNVLSEKGTIARLYINRLDRGMRLQSDPTIRFALNDYTIRRVRASHLKVDSPYNTYLHYGLPPGPIRTTSRATIDAVLDSEPNNYIYMCAKEDFSGTHNFASDYAEHTANALRYQHALDNRGIK